MKFTSVADASDYAGESNRAKDEARIPIKEIMGDPEFSVEKIRRILDQKTYLQISIHQKSNTLRLDLLVTS